MKMKKVIALTLALCLMLAALAACGDGGKSDSGNVLKVATSPDFAPMAFVDTSKSGQDQYVGFDMMLAKYIAEEMGKELVIMPMSFEACTTAVSMGTVDMAISGFSWREDREEGFNLSDFYYPGDNESDQVVITLKENEGKFSSPEDFNGVKVGAQTGSLQESLCQEQLPDCELVTIGELGTGLLQLKNGDFEAMAVAKGQADVFMSNDPAVALSGFQFEVDEKYTANVVVMKKGADDLTQEVNGILKKAYDSNVYGDWYEEAKELAMSATANEVTYDDEGNAPAGDESSSQEEE
ncbi:transporter substrate-binding domain-containing protein [Acutalibacter sp. 1XD8-33]|uniref:transporter substrate-binding domain-containing protein n=1 Tax=Acutalibacter sp. 1XD8-33 TaxID=2320081 RepID=UPI001314EDD1|nr:transporter substrate-binding domain-containing protein [Acutalibacter sp. 1XD8-33]